MMNLGLHTRRVQAQLAPLRHLGLPGQCDHAVIELVQRFRSQGGGPADQGGIVGCRFPEQAREPAQHQALVHPIFGLLIAPAEQVLEQEHAQQHFHWGGMSSMHQGLPIAFPKVVAHLLVHLVIVKEEVQLLEHGVDPFGHLRHPCKDIFLGVAIDQHVRTPPCPCFLFYPYSITSPASFHTVTFPSLLHVVSSGSPGPISHRILVLEEKICCPSKTLCIFRRRKTVRYLLLIYENEAATETN
jgi:hypothetical protein